MKLLSIIILAALTGCAASKPAPFQQGAGMGARTCTATTTNSNGVTSATVTIR